MPNPVACLHNPARRLRRLSFRASLRRAGVGGALATVLACVAALPVQADAVRARQWGLEFIHAERAWSVSRGAGVTVAVLDTGIDGRHPDLRGSVTQGSDFTGVARRGTPYWGRHGTAVASLIAGHGHGPRNADGVMGVAPRAKVLSVRVALETNDPLRTSAEAVGKDRPALARGMRYAVDRGADVIVISLGGDTFSTRSRDEEAAIGYALGKGVVVVAATGDDGTGTNQKGFPAAYRGVIAVGAVDRDGRRAPFSNYPSYVSVAAPGTSMIAADGPAGYRTSYGTSYSAAMTAGVAALVRARYPELTPAQVRQAIEKGASRKPPAGKSTGTGRGTADAWKALSAARAMAAISPTPSVTPSPTATAQVANDTPQPLWWPYRVLLLIGLITTAVLLLLGAIGTGVARLRRRDAEQFRPPPPAQPAHQPPFPQRGVGPMPPTWYGPPVAGTAVYPPPTEPIARPQAWAPPPPGHPAEPDPDVAAKAPTERFLLVPPPQPPTERFFVVPPEFGRQDSGASNRSLPPKPPPPPD